MRLAFAAGTLAVHTHVELVVRGAHALNRPTASAAPMPSLRYDVLALSPSGRQLIAERRYDISPRALGLLDLAAAAMRPLRDHPRLNRFDLTFVDERNALVVATDRNAAATRQGLARFRKGWGLRADVYLGDVEELGGGPLTLPAPVRAAWPAGEGRLWKKLPKAMEPWERGGVSSESRLSSNRFGRTLTDSTVGTVVVFDEGAPERCAAFRVPTEYPEVELSAAATKAGFVVAHSGGRSTGAINHFSRDGAHLGGLQFQGNVSPLVVLEDELFFLRAHGDTLELVCVSLPRLTMSSVHPTSLPAFQGLAGLTANEDGSGLWGGSGGRVLQFLRARAGWDTHGVDLAAKG